MANNLIKTSISIKVFLWSIFIVYFHFLVTVILIKHLPLELITYQLQHIDAELISSSFAQSNLIPFKTIANYITDPISLTISIRNIIGNIIVFMPLGFLTPLIFLNKYKFKAFLKVATLVSFSVSLLFELIQLLTALGSFDVDDLILNTLGGVLGGLILILLLKLYNQLSN